MRRNGNAAAVAASPEYRSVAPRNVRPFIFSNDNAERHAQLAKMVPELHRLGIAGLTPSVVARMKDALDSGAWGMDANLQATITTPSITTPVQFLQNWLPGFIEVITAVRLIDELTGMSTSGSWEDEEIVQGILEQLGTAIPYGDTTNVPRSSWNANWERRTVVRFEEGMAVGRLEEARAARVQINTADQKRQAATLALDIQRNFVGFYGFNSGNGRTYGFLNDPNLPAASVLPNGASASPAWSTKTFLEICKDIRLMVAALRLQAQGNIDPMKSQMTLAIAIGTIDYLSVTSDFGISVQDWLNKAYPMIRVIGVPELTNAIASSNELFLYAESVSDASTDDKRTWIQVVPAKFRMIGVEQKAKGYEEDYSNATAGVLLKRPYAVVRRYGN